MPMGSPQDEIGVLNEQDGSYTLRRDGGGTWRLDLNGHDYRRARELAGQRVRVTGTRGEFDLIDVETIAAV